MSDDERPSKVQKLIDGRASPQGHNGGWLSREVSFEEQQGSTTFTQATVQDAEQPPQARHEPASSTTAFNTAASPNKAEENHRPEVSEGAAEQIERGEGGSVPKDEQSLSEKPLSKNQLKKLQRQKRWDEGKAARKAKQKEKRAATRAQRVVQRDEQNGPDASTVATAEPIDPEADGAALEPGALPIQKPGERPRHRKQSLLLPIAFVVDCSFDDLMTEKETKSLSSQLIRCYSENRISKYRAFLAISSFGGALQKRFETAMANHHRSWKGVRFEEEDWLSAAEETQRRMREHEHALPEAAGPEGVAKEWLKGTKDESDRDQDKGEIVYLTSDSPNTLTKLSPYSVYVIGGLVDRNRHKGICYQRAMDRGAKTAKLPIGDYMQMTSRFVLTTNQVAEIMLRWLEYGDWAKAFLDGVPKRKGGVLKPGIKDEGEEEKEDAYVRAEDQ
ncbi:MAG: tRNA (guanine(9)-N(1))-methyltransferase [Lichina confinis]|nr:MAG: tRNA (guanine(9)-N(1))-methyltransferase [Lichina confinis]